LQKQQELKAPYGADGVAHECKNSILFQSLPALSLSEPRGALGRMRCQITNAVPVMGGF
jgi:hypothetical protein